ncbi:hypothetical protein BO99DRAFT_262460 [Aspergillus violaceofuscus CBS 115571]|uniref:Uncharacterized protein n=1 Tax=Aspergillus violaceofuscus (strain CBS 115571) TaxID=1450538 RepID=A0A2V5H0R4_ASPV1|nr:hypothetical protein BO99DRAFT_262460 [Aspergillus violaceofuscus CBS 115571]
MKRPVIMTRSLVSLPLALFHSHEPILSVVRRFIPPPTRAARTGNRSRRQLYSTLVQLSTIHICYAVILICRGCKKHSKNSARLYRSKQEGRGLANQT